ncbi:M14 family zinc carboxypeptidase [Thalassotalea sp. PLHSN55]|uniref:M14 family zinc carboxypeptidase n=1 Tax=Thalassotalea sp. PLHSN55 TaxID=3435888 RepID=UPI003F870118
MPDHYSTGGDVNRTFVDYLSAPVRKLLPEYTDIARIIEQSEGLITTTIFDVFQTTLKNGQTVELPLLGMSFGSDDAQAPAITFVGGIHGIERIGSQVVLSYLHSLINRAKWDSATQHSLQKLRFNFLPVMNPVGMLRGRRCNGNGVDLMRNAPISATDKVPWLVGGQQFSRYLPWYRGKLGLERENQHLIGFLENDCLTRKFNLVVDCHSGFGFQDRLWLPYAYRKRPPRKVANYFALYQLWQNAYPHHAYVFEPQSRHYNTHGDLWDYVSKIVKHQYQQPFLSLTLEMGSWNWVKKRPRQLFSYRGLFNPDVAHRWARVQRSHLVLFDFLSQASLNYQHWLPNADNKAQLRKAAIEHWYRD